MSVGVIYEIARFTAGSDVEELVERVQVISRGGVLWRRTESSQQTRCTQSEVILEIASDPLLNEVRPNEVTRIKADPAALRELPFVLQVPGDGFDFDNSLWSAAMIHEHLECFPGTDARGVYRVLYVNNHRWGAFTAVEGERMLPESEYDAEVPALKPHWGDLSFIENDQMMGGGQDMTQIGLATPGVVVSVFMTSEDWADHELCVDRRQSDDAKTFVDWLLSGTLVSRYASFNSFVDVMMAQLFIEATIKDRSGQPMTGSFLVAGVDEDEEPTASDSSEWSLRVELEPVLVNQILDRLAQQSPSLRDIVAAAREPTSSAGRSLRRARKE